jgi:hypothetical protein
MSGMDRLAELGSAYRAAGGAQPSVVIRRIWLGESRADLIAGQRRFYQRQGAPVRAFPEDQTVTAADPDELAHRIAEALTASGADALNLRLHLPGVGPADIRDQIVHIGEEAIPILRLLRSPHAR